ncbi:transcriptional regulator Kaiso [Pelobates cultripes]|uniref:Transcriptional regulator Kaiso n=1 Tax=Pelobates cultripes TaxID=61616 RepID=A0AAD1SZA7_PELCU|nr:transcriptional regulator Kaiso [Pelobates cultripes]
MDANKLITATDNQYSGSLLEALNDQRMQGLYCDVTVIVEDRKFKAHKNILSACSTYFHQLFCVAGQVVELNFVKANVFAEILNYIYSARVVRVKGDLLEELIKSGKLLGVPFIANLGIPLLQVKNISGGVNDGTTDPESSADEKGSEPLANVASTSAKKSTDNEMPVIMEACTSSVEDLKDKLLNSKDVDSDDDVIFCSEIVTAKPPPPHNKESLDCHPLSNEQSIDSKKTITSSDAQSEKLSVTSNTNSGTPPINASSSTLVHSKLPLSALPTNDVSHNSPGISTFQKHMPPYVSMDGPKFLPSSNILPKTEIILDESCVSGPVSTVIAQKNISYDGSGVQKKQVVTFSQASSLKPGEFKIKISDVASGIKKETHRESEVLHRTDRKKIITLDKASEIEGLSTGCKVYANIGEDTYDIVIPIKDDPDEGFSKLDEDGFPNRKRMKVKDEDHYELIVDGRVYYICIVCKRSYVCLKSLRRHFNVHSWERKYPCRYCERVFPLAEYRTKHEINHTGERRYQCLTCGSTFLNYHLMSSHMKSVHSLDPSGDSKLYRLNPCKTLQIRQCGFVSDPSISAPVSSDGGIVYDIDPDQAEPASAENIPTAAPKPVNWDNIFLHQNNQSVSSGSTEFEFVIPESY